MSSQAPSNRSSRVPSSRVPGSQKLSSAWLLTEAAGVKLSEATVAPVPLDMVEISDVDAGRKVAKLIDALEDHDDVQNVSSNYTLTEEVAEKLTSES